MRVDHVLDRLSEKGFAPRLAGFSALDRYCGFKPGPYRWVRSRADLADLSRLFLGLRFPGPSLADAAVDSDPSDDPAPAAATDPAAAKAENSRPGRTTWYLRCEESAEPEDDDAAFPLLRFSWDASSRSYIDPGELYPIVRALRDGIREGASPRGKEFMDPAPWYAAGAFRGSRGTTADAFKAASQAAVVLARYRGAAPEDEAGSRAVIAEVAAAVGRVDEGPAPSAEEQRALLTVLLQSRRPDLGFDLLMRVGWVDAWWPELAAMDDVDHSKEFHPEGNAWAHTLETFRYRKIADPVLSFGLLLHDVGKPLSEASGGRRFDRHAELGAARARTFLARLGFDDAFIADVSFMVRNHMMPAALPRLPLTRSQEVLESSLFPLLLELYRCDESSSFKGLEGFYESCAAYRSYLRNVKNPYRSADGKKMMRILFER
ncbi:MAG: hypothetical protein A2Y36_14730 [Treponema sp. GWA1_62_8]|nr:MAG: hypothetical protein A2Y36_14730 [Treponema sp. GWA1_62_8]